MTTQKDLMEQATKEYGLGGNADYFRFDKSDTYRLRVLTQCHPMGSYFFGKGIKPKIAYSEMEKPKDEDGNDIQPTVKFVGYVLDRQDGKIKIAELTYSVMKALIALQEDEDYKFDDFPMPYDIKVTFNKDAAPNDKYKVLAVPKQEPLTEQEAADLEEKMKNLTPETYIQKRKDKQREEDNAAKNYDGQATEYPEDEIKAEDIPF